MTQSIDSIAIVTDAAADVPIIERSAGSVEWVVLAETWQAGGFDFLDDGSASSELTSLLLESGLDPEPVEPSRDAFITAYDRLQNVDRVFSVHSASGASWAIERAHESVGGFPNVRIIEAGVTGIGLGLLCVCARDLASKGGSPDTVESFLRAHSDRVRMLVVPDRLHPGSSQQRISARLLIGSSMLRAGGLGTLDRSKHLRSRRATIAAIERYFLENTSNDGDSDLRVALGHGGAAGAVDPLLDLLERMRPDLKVELVGRIGPRLLQQLKAPCVAAAWLEILPQDQW